MAVDQSQLNIVGIAGSLRQASVNAGLLRAAADVAPSGTNVQIASILDFPLYNEDMEMKHGVPAAVAELKDRIASASALLLATPEYNHSFPGVLKNAIDWLTRPPEDIGRVFAGRPVALMGATLGRSGTALAQAAWLPVLRALGTRPWFGGQLLVSSANRVLDDEGMLTDEELRQRLKGFMAGFTEFVAKC